MFNTVGNILINNLAQYYVVHKVNAVRCLVVIINMDDCLHDCLDFSTLCSPFSPLKRVENSSCLQAPPETPRRCIHCHPVHVPSTPNNYMQHPMQYYTPTHCIEGQNGTYTPHRGSSYHGGEFSTSSVMI